MVSGCYMIRSATRCGDAACSRITMGSLVADTPTTSEVFHYLLCIQHLVNKDEYYITRRRLRNLRYYQ